MYTTPTQTNTIIPNDLCHPYGYKIARNNYLINRVHTYPIIKEAKTKEQNIIHDILYDNEYNKNVSTRHLKHRRHNKNTGLQHQNTKWDILICSGKETRNITKLLKNTNTSSIPKKKNNTKIVTHNSQIHK
jgi:hypothetical protein